MKSTIEQQYAIIAKLVKALDPFAEHGRDLTDLWCHRGICAPDECGRCEKVIAARQALTKLRE